LISLARHLGEDIFPADSHHAFYFDLTIDQDGQVISILPTLNEIEKAKRFWSDIFTKLLRRRE